MSRQSVLISACRHLILCGLLFAFFQICATAQPKPEEVVFHSGKLDLQGFLWRPNGPGPFPAVLWNHGSEKLPGSQPHLAEFYTSHFYAFFVPHRRGQGRSPGAYIQDLGEQTPPNRRAQRMGELQEEEVAGVARGPEFRKDEAFLGAGRSAD